MLEEVLCNNQGDAKWEESFVRIACKRRNSRVLHTMAANPSP